MGKQLANGQRPIILQVTHNGVSRRYSIGEACLPEQWDADSGRMKPRAKGAAQVNSVLNVIESKVKESVDALVVHVALSLESFDKRYRNPKATADLLAYMHDMEVKLKAEGRTGYSIMFRNAVSALRRFNDDKPVRFHELTARRLEAFEAVLKADGCAAGGIATYMRVIRVAMNQAIKDGLLAPEQYPFETARHKGYSMKRLKATTRPRSLSEDDLTKMKAFPFNEHPKLACTVRLFLFSYYARGINFADIARLDLGSVQNGRMLYTRTKTKRKGEGANFSIPVSQPMEAILDHFRDSNSRYLFPILKGTERTEAEVWSRIKDRLQHVNRDLKAVSKILGIPSLTFYVARHTFATTLKRRGVDVSVISESMGHDNVGTTTAYLKRFENEVLDAADTLL
jgi:integrase/recombinase XerD